MPYRLRVRAGPSVSELRMIPVNTDDHPIVISSPYFTGRLVVRVRNFTGLSPAHAPPSHRTSPYFESSNDLYSIQVQGRFKNRWSCDDVVFGNEFESPIKLPTGSGIAVRFVKWFDPGLDCDIYSDRPWAYSPLIVTMNTMRMIETRNVEGWARPKGHVMLGKEEEALELPAWGSARGTRIEEGFHIAGSGRPRRKHFARKKNREKFEITEGQVWEMDFHNQYVDFDKFRLRLPGFDINVLNYWRGKEPLRYIAKTRDGSAVFFVVEFMLVDMDEEGDDYVVVDESADGLEGPIVGRGPGSIRWNERHLINDRKTEEDTVTMSNIRKEE